jgi:hypothetical protein
MKCSGFAGMDLELLTIANSAESRVDWDCNTTGDTKEPLDDEPVAGG